jgi:hypothetical protein
MTEKKEMQDKPLDKMTVTELREVAKEIPSIIGAHGMKKAELLAAIQEAKGIVIEAPQKTKAKPKPKTALTVQEMKALIKGLRTEREKALADKDKKMAKIIRRRISRLKKKTRQAA